MVIINSDLIPEKLNEYSIKYGFKVKEIEYFDGYYITSNGQVWGKRKNDFLKPCITNGYKRVCLCKNGKVFKEFVHRLVGKAFIPNPNDYPQINHKDEVKTNNNVDNLEWCTQLQNNRYGTRTQRMAISQLNRKDCSKSVIQMDKNNNYIATYPSTKEAWRQTGISHIHIREVCSGKPKYHTAGGYKWKWAERSE